MVDEGEEFLGFAFGENETDRRDAEENLLEVGGKRGLEKKKKRGIKGASAVDDVDGFL